MILCVQRGTGEGNGKNTEEIRRERIGVALISLEV